MSARSNKRHSASQRRRRRGTENDARPLERPLGRDRRGRVVFVACEGEKTEPDYLEYLDETFGPGTPDRPQFSLHPIAVKNGMRPTQTVDMVVKDAGTDEAWVLFDRDGTDRDADIQKALVTAAANKVEVGFSHPSFDLWLLLHFQAFTGAQSGRSTVVVERLRNSKATDAFRDYDKRNNKNVSAPARRDALRDNEQRAVDRARALVNQCEHGDCQAAKAKWDPVARSATKSSESRDRPSWQSWAARSGHAEHCPVLRRDPSTDVWRLLVTLGIATAP
ncbi:RloB family protein [Nocardia jiangxiensis]|uniref:RloB family protein n=1 Tax=Nocardia jiangxiensis TaxID=282685 RepID=UPI0012F6EB72|nr:RloB family protein [Nocardia jiangxiensis]